MSTLVMALAAGLALGSGPEAVSAEMEQPLDLRGEWKGTWISSSGQCYEVRLVEHGACARRLPRGKEGPEYLWWAASDEGKGKLQMVWVTAGSLGIYEQDGDRVRLCVRDAGSGRPTSFRGGSGQHLLTLCRVK
jgi:hypothetical protein